MTTNGRRADANGPPRMPRLALSKSEAAQALGVSVGFFDEHAVAELHIVRRARRRLIPFQEFDRSLPESAERCLGERWS
jgi:hypothetical protein